MLRPSRDKLDRDIRAMLVEREFPIQHTDDRPRFDDAHEQLIALHVNELDRLWALAECCIVASAPSDPGFDFSDVRDPYTDLGGES